MNPKQMNTSRPWKTKTGILIMLFLLSLGATAQRFEGGLIGGLNATQVDGDHVKGYTKPGVLLGAYVQTNIGKFTFAGMELKYSQKGSRKIPSAKESDQLKYIMRLGYFEIPAYFGMYTGENVSMFIGASVGYLAHAAEYDNYGLVPNQEKRPFQDFDFEAFLGVRFAVNKRISIDVRGAYSFLPMRDLPDATYYYWLNDEFNNVLSTAIYYKLGRR